VAPTNGCIKRRKGGDDDGYYCICNAMYCDKAPDAVKPLNLANYILITSTKSGLFFHVTNGVFQKIKETNGKY